MGFLESASAYWVGTPGFAQTQALLDQLSQHNVTDPQNAIIRGEIMASIEKLKTEPASNDGK